MDDNRNDETVQLPTAGQSGDVEVAPVGQARRHRRRTAAIAGAAALCLGLIAGGTALVAGRSTSVVATTQDPALSQGVGGTGMPSMLPARGRDSTSGSAQTSTAALDIVSATATQQVGLVTITTTLGYQDASAAGTGIVLTSSGTVLTNNHVIAGATSIQVTVESTDAVYTATVVGTDTTDDVAVLQLTAASGLATATLDTAGTTVGAAVTAVGNAEGGGVLVAAPGTVSALDATVTTQSEVTGEPVTLDNLLAIDADVVSGDSGGAVLDAQGEVVGMTTAASSGSSNVTGYAITIADALGIADQIIAGTASSTITIGYPAFLGVQTSSAVAGQGGPAGNTSGTSSSGALISGVLSGTPAQSAGLAGGDTITALDGSAVDSVDTLTALLAAHHPGDQVTVTWTTGTTGAARTATVTLIAGPAA